MRGFWITGVILGLWISTAFAGGQQGVLMRITDRDDGGQERVFYQKDKPIARQVVDADGNLVDQKGQIPEGMVTGFSGSVKQYEAIYKNNKRHGRYREYFDDETVKKETNYRNGKLDGLYREYYSDGELHIAASFKDGIQFGNYREYNEEGEVAREFQYDSWGKMIQKAERRGNVQLQ